MLLLTSRLYQALQGTPPRQVAPTFTPRPGFPALEGALTPEGTRAWQDGEMDPVYGWVPQEEDWFLQD